ncbi:MAG: hypothetical protein A3J93_04630 [Candidatus Magasanikbacteria bacterium RIFOXYC2_FULL_42_28]|uniref:Uncharacterized protein n=1 Tax=Candidatus Magasanikbacteria bacterium RIFOXYC2_FULL_42_28 TaxID=1798704 RepID=A0A1F6NXH3_9BACT|nr:MAG: hypothetical protein A3J93_04630 [Candidatus Magasanikbacteria bacterium RIFOXYC2_FULL_42_28]
MKIGIIIAIIAIVALLFWSPWLNLKGGENAAEIFSRNMTAEQRTEADAATKLYACGNGIVGDGCCDGVSAHWAPFGARAGYCDYVTEYIPFWGK